MRTDLEGALQIFAVSSLLLARTFLGSIAGINNF